MLATRKLSQVKVQLRRTAELHVLRSFKGKALSKHQLKVRATAGYGYATRPQETKDKWSLQKQQGGADISVSGLVGEGRIATLFR